MIWLAVLFLFSPKYADPSEVNPPRDRANLSAEKIGSVRIDVGIDPSSTHLPAAEFGRDGTPRRDNRHDRIKGGANRFPPLISNDGLVPQDVVAADFNHDGFDDLAICYAGDDTVRWFLGNGDGTLTFRGEREVGVQPGPVNDHPRAMVAEDFDRDGFIDLAVFSVWPASASRPPTNSSGRC